MLMNYSPSWLFQPVPLQFYECFGTVLSAVIAHIHVCVSTYLKDKMILMSTELGDCPTVTRERDAPGMYMAHSHWSEIICPIKQGNISCTCKNWPCTHIFNCSLTFLLQGPSQKDKKKSFSGAYMSQDSVSNLPMHKLQLEKKN